MKLWTITVELKSGEEKTYVVAGDTASHAKNRLRGKVEVQYTKNSRPYAAETDRELERIGQRLAHVTGQGHENTYPPRWGIVHVLSAE